MSQRTIDNSYLTLLIVMYLNSARLQYVDEVIGDDNTWRG